MKKKSVFKLFVIVAIFCAVVFSACKQEPAPQKRIIVNGIPATHNGRYASVGLAAGASNDVVAVSYPLAISSGAVNMSLIDAKASGLTPFTGSGTYMVVFYITDSTQTADYYSGFILSKSIREETTTIPFNEIIPISSSSSVQQMPLSVKDVLPGIVKKLTE